MALPIDTALPSLINALRAADAVVLSAAPGAGKTTRVPLAIHEAGFIKGRILMLEPRRLAAVRSAQFMAKQQQEAVGETVGYRIRGESRVGAQTQIEVVTEGILTRLLQSDPALTGIGLIIFDEFHERSLHTDLGLALVRDTQKLLREDLKILVMSATLDGVAVSRLLDGAPVIESPGRQYPVSVFYQPRNTSVYLETEVVSLILRAIQEQQGDILVFLPGQAEIRRCQQALEKQLDRDDIRVHSLFGEGSPSQQQSALTPDPSGKRKVILSTSIAETSLTIDGVRVVVDAGLVRTLKFDPRRGMAGLVTIPVSQATAEQRAGRAGRQHSGACYRLWSESQQERLARFPSAEILQSDLMPLALELACWGTLASELAFLDPPPPALLNQATTGLQQLGALDSNLKITPHGREMNRLPVHPRMAHMLIRAQEHQLGSLACDVAALLEERDILRGNSAAPQDADFHSRLSALHHGGGDAGTRDRVRRQATRLRQMLSIDDHKTKETTHDKLGLMLALCYPERVAKKRDGGGERWLMASGVGASLPAHNAFVHHEWIAVADVDGEGREAKIFLAAELSLDDLRVFFPEWWIDENEVFWSARDKAVIARQVQRFGAILISEQALSQKALSATETQSLKEKIPRVLCEGLRSLGWQGLPLDEQSRQWLLRVQWLQRCGFLEKEIPDFSEQALLESLEQWLAPFLEGMSKTSHLSQVRWLEALQSQLVWSQQQQVDQLAPSHLTVPTGSRIVLDYSGPQPVLAVRLQEMFGERETPRIAHGKVPVLLHLLSPGRAPLAVTQDLASFWQNAYKDVCKDMRGQYKRHYWPDNPLEADPTKRTKAADDRAKKNNGA